MIKGYDAICTVGVADSIVPAIDAATKAGIPVYTFNSETEKESSRVAFVGQDLYNAGVLAGDTLAELIGEEGQVGISSQVTTMYTLMSSAVRVQRKLLANMKASRSLVTLKTMTPVMKLIQQQRTLSQQTPRP